MSDQHNTPFYEGLSAKQLESQLQQLHHTIDRFTENLITLKAEYSNEKAWVHNLLRDHTTDIDKALDRLSRVEGRLNNGMNDTIVDLKQAIARLDVALKDLETRIREEDIKVEERVSEVVKDKSDELAERYKGLEGNLKDDKASRNAGTTLTLMIIGQILMFIGLLYTILN